MKPQKKIRLTRKTAVALICGVMPIPKSSIQGGEQAPGVYAYTATFGELVVSCTSNWRDSSGRIQLTVSDGSGGGTLRMYFHPETLNRDYVAEDAWKEADRLETRKDWVQRVGRERAHRFVDRYCEGSGDSD